MQHKEKHTRNYVKITVLLMLHLGKSAEEIALCLGLRKRSRDKGNRASERPSDAPKH